MGQVSGDFQMPGMVRALGLCFYVCLFIGRKVTMDFISLTFRFVIKCQTLVRIVQTTHFVPVAFLNLEIVQLSRCLALPAWFLPLTALCSLWVGTLTPAAPCRDSQPHRQPRPALEAGAWLRICGPSGLACLILPALP